MRNEAEIIHEYELINETMEKEEQQPVVKMSVMSEIVEESEKSYTNSVCTSEIQTPSSDMYRLQKIDGRIESEATPKMITEVDLEDFQNKNESEDEAEAEEMMEDEREDVSIP